MGERRKEKGKETTRKKERNEGKNVSLCPCPWGTLDEDERVGHVRSHLASAARSQSMRRAPSKSHRACAVLQPASRRRCAGRQRQRNKAIKHHHLASQPANWHRRSPRRTNERTHAGVSPQHSVAIGPHCIASSRLKGRARVSKKKPPPQNA
jgi:hypothetical protein